MAAARELLMKFLEDKFIKFIIKKIFGSLVTGGFKVWLVKYISTEFFEEIALPIMHYGINEGEFQLDVVEGKAIIKAKDDALINGDTDAYDSAVDDAFN